MMKRAYSYVDTDSDVVVNASQPQTLPADYDWQNRRFAGIINPLATGFAWGYRVARQVQVIGAEKLVPGAFVYANHTQPIGDVFLPRTLPLPVAIIAGAANLGVPLVGRHLAAGRALLLPSTRRQYPAFLHALRQRHDEGDVVVVYPEAHVWPYYTGIRPFGSAALHYPVALDAPVFTATTVYLPRRHSSKPKLVQYLDGPLQVAATDRKQRQHALWQAVEAQLRRRAAQSTYTGVTYHQVKEANHD